MDAEEPDQVQIVTSTQRSVDLPGIQVSSEPSEAAVRKAALYADGSVSQVALQSDSAPREIDGLRLSVVPVAEKEDQLKGVKVRAGDRAAIIDKITTHYSQKRRKSRRRRRKHLKRKRQFHRGGRRGRRQHRRHRANISALFSLGAEH